MFTFHKQLESSRPLCGPPWGRIKNENGAQYFQATQRHPVYQKALSGLQANGRVLQSFVRCHQNHNKSEQRDWVPPNLKALFQARRKRGDFSLTTILSRLYDFSQFPREIQLISAFSLPTFIVLPPGLSSIGQSSLTGGTPLST